MSAKQAHTAEDISGKNGGGTMLKEKTQHMVSLVLTINSCS